MQLKNYNANIQGKIFSKSTHYTAKSQFNPGETGILVKMLDNAGVTEREKVSAFFI